MSQPLKVVFIAGAGRSGTTLLASLLGQLEGWFAAGETWFLWERGLLQNSDCGCSLPFRECPCWSAAAADYLEMPEADVRAIIHKRDQINVVRGRFLSWSRAKKREQKALLSEVGGHLGSIYDRLAQTTGARVIVDSSKGAEHGFILQQLDRVDLHVVHVVRDPRSVAYSWSHRVKVYDVNDGKARHFGKWSLSKSLRDWVRSNVVTEFSWGRTRGKYLRLRYEDLMADPARALARVTELLQDPAPVDFIHDGPTARMEPCHIVAGNPSRFNHGDVPLRLDDEWREHSSPRVNFLATAATWPFLLRYGYGLGAAPPA